MAINDQKPGFTCSAVTVQKVCTIVVRASNPWSKSSPKAELAFVLRACFPSIASTTG